MKRSSILELRNPRWERLFEEECDLEVQLIPSEMPDLSSSRILGYTPQSLENDICSRCFVDFRNYTDDDGTPIPNSLEKRLELYRIPVFRARINNALSEANTKFLKGEDVAASG